MRHGSCGGKVEIRHLHLVTAGSFYVCSPVSAYMLWCLITSASHLLRTLHPEEPVDVRVCRLNVLWIYRQFVRHDYCWAVRRWMIHSENGNSQENLGSGMNQVPGGAALAALLDLAPFSTYIAQRALAGSSGDTPQDQEVK